MAEPNPPSQLDPIQSRVRHQSQDQASADDPAPTTSGEAPSQASEGPVPVSPEVEPQATGQVAFEGAVLGPATVRESLTSPQVAQSQAREAEAADRMRVYRGLSRELTESEWKSSGTRKLILEQLAQRENEVAELKAYRSQYHEKDKESAVLRQKLRQATAVDLLFDFALAAGGTLVGLSTFLFDKGHSVLGLVVLLIGLIFFISPLVLKYYQKGD